LLLGLVLVVAVVVVFTLLRPGDTAPEAQAKVLEKPAPSPGWLVRYNATLTLARRGSTKLPLPIVAEMLDEDQQLRNFMFKTPEGVEVLDEQAARRTVFNALKALADWHKHKDTVQALGTNNTDLLRVYAAVDKLTQSSNSVLRQEAETFRKKVASGEW
jgi:hypothetical protein